MQSIRKTNMRQEQKKRILIFYVLYNRGDIDNGFSLYKGTVK